MISQDLSDWQQTFANYDSYVLHTVMNILDGWFPNTRVETLYSAASDITSALVDEGSTYGR